MTVFDLEKGRSAVILSVDSHGAELNRLRSLGIEEGAQVQCLGFSLFKSAVLLKVGYSRVAMRKSLAVRVEVSEAAV